MRIIQLTMPTRDPNAVERFYGDRLGLAVRRDVDRVEVEVGSTRMHFSRSAPFDGAQHLAFTIPTGSLAAAKAWLVDRAELFELDGADEFEGPAGWNSRSLYFDGPDRQVLELIERRELVSPPVDGFGPERILDVSEVGIAVPDIGGAVERLRLAGSEPYAGTVGERFAAVGDLHGLLVLAAPRRIWWPTIDRVAAESSVLVRADGIDLAVELAPGVRIEPVATAVTRPR
ncbi:VOC family protein [Agromyces sp. NPDC058126]|uniref:VOC family protein n=1 Tax=Agromyces sp. NPDC058126 TaxID=3346350 RepID=UPI0036DC66AB